MTPNNETIKNTGIVGVVTAGMAGVVAAGSETAIIAVTVICSIGIVGIVVRRVLKPDDERRWGS
jgi:hypothetical protein